MAWQPPETPDPCLILTEASDDRRNRRFDTALAKILWFHEHAADHQPSISVVRRSFALSYWLKLASLYPPAMDAFKNTRDRTEELFRLDYASYDFFADISSMNERLGAEYRTARLFCDAAAKSHTLATRYYRVAERSLVTCGLYKECGPFLECDKRFRHAVDNYRMSVELESKRLPPGSLPKTAVKRFTNNVATLIALLTINDRLPDAESLRDRASRVLKSQDFLDTLNSALSGHFPPPRWGNNRVHRRTRSERLDH